MIKGLAGGLKLQMRQRSVFNILTIKHCHINKIPVLYLYIYNLYIYIITHSYVYVYYIYTHIHIISVPQSPRKSKKLPPKSKKREKNKQNMWCIFPMISHPRIPKSCHGRTRHLSTTGPGSSAAQLRTGAEGAERRQVDGEGEISPWDLWILRISGKQLER